MEETKLTQPSENQSGPSRPLDAQELEQIADRIIELMKRQISLEREREGKTR